VLPGREAPAVERVEMARVDADLLDTMLTMPGEVSIFRARLDQQVNSIGLQPGGAGAHRDALEGAIARAWKSRPRRSFAPPTTTSSRGGDDFDPLELDRYSTLQQFSRALAETSATSPAFRGCSRP